MFMVLLEILLFLKSEKVRMHFCRKVYKSFIFFRLDSEKRKHSDTTPPSLSIAKSEKHRKKKNQTSKTSPSFQHVLVRSHFVEGPLSSLWPWIWWLSKNSPVVFMVLILRNL